MDSSKTRIWRGGLEAITHASASDETSAPGVDLRATRIMPIERLLPAEEQRPQPPSRESEQPTLRLPRRQRRWPLALAGGFTLVAAVAVQVQLMTAHRREVAPAQTAVVSPAPVLQRDEATSRSDARAELPQFAPVAPIAPIPASKLARRSKLAPPAARASTPKPGASRSIDRDRLERSAVDSVIAGDYSNAARMYRELSESETSHVFSVAARVLDARKAAP